MMIDYVFELPHNDPLSGGVYHTLNVAAVMDNASVRFNRISHRRDMGAQRMSVGFPDNAFPECQYAITYSDSTHLSKLLRLPQVGRVAVLMLSYGMSIERERANVLTDGVTVLTSTLRNQQHIVADGGKCHHVGFGFDPTPFYRLHQPLPTERYAALYRDSCVTKRYDLARGVLVELCQEGLLDGFITFGSGTVVIDVLEHEYCKGHLPNATVSDLRELFNRCSIFIMPAIRGGLNRTPAEATLCGCPSILCEGARDELYFPDVNCKWAPKDNPNALLRAAKDILSNDYSAVWAEDMKRRVAPYTFDAIAGRIREVMENIR